MQAKIVPVKRKQNIKFHFWSAVTSFLKVYEDIFDGFLLIFQIVSFVQGCKSANPDPAPPQSDALLDGSNVRLNWNIEYDVNVNWIKFKNFLSLYWFKNKQHWI